MINEVSLESICKKYGINYVRLIQHHDSILKRGNYEEIESMLKLLINDLKIQPKNIEKCPSILYKNVEVVEENINFLKSEHFKMNSIESCLHILSADPDSFKQMYYYVTTKYGAAALYKHLSILSVPIDILKAVENLYIPNIGSDGNLTIAMGIDYENTTLKDLINVLDSEEYRMYSHLFTPYVLAHADYNKFKIIFDSKEFKEHPELITSTTLVDGNLSYISDLVNSPEYKNNPKLFTSESLVRTSLDNIKKLLESDEYKEHPEWFNATTLCNAKIEDIQALLAIPECQEHLDIINASIIAKARAMVEKLPKLVSIAKMYDIEEYITSSYLLYSISQRYALINYLLDNNQPLVVDGKLSYVFSYTAAKLKKKYGIDMAMLEEKYPYSDELIRGQAL